MRAGVRRRWVLGSLAGVLAVVAAVTYGVPAFGTGTITASVVLTKPKGSVIPCGGSVSGVGDIVVNAYGTATQAGGYRMRVSYGANGGLEAWYDDITQQFPANAQTLFTQAVQDVEPTATSFTVQAGQADGAKVSCTVSVSNVPSPSEGTKSARPVITGGFVDQLAIVITDYKTNAPIPCNSSFATRRVNEAIMALSSVARTISVHTHEERPDTNGPDQDGDQANFRWWEFTTPQQVSVPANAWTQVAAVVGNVTAGKNVFHAAEQSADGTGPQTFCSFTAT